MQCLFSNESKKVKGLSNLDGPRTPHIFLNTIFPIDLFCSFYLPGNFVFWGVPLLKMQTHLSYLVMIIVILIVILQKKKDFSGKFCVERVTVLWLEANLEPYQTSVMALLCKKRKQLRDITFCKKLNLLNLLKFSL